MNWRRISVIIMAACASGLAIGGCGGSSTPAASSGGATTATTTTPTTAATAIEVAYAGGAITGGGRKQVKTGDTVTITVSSDVADEVHVHGYDKKVNVVPGTPATITFTADIPGIFDVELESRSLKLIDLVVQ
jgi:heme/copper-type cytochrome/quinol oxidase subunit 2